MAKTTALMNCTCSNKAQDELYGVGKRVFNLTAKGSNSPAAIMRCSVCSSTRTIQRKELDA